MKTILRIFGRVMLIGATVLAVAIAYSTVKGDTAWYFRVNGSVIVDGHPTDGYMHADTQRSVLLLTRTDGSHPETYVVPLTANKVILDCGAWHPIRFLPNPVRNLNPRCFDVKAQPADVMDSPVNTTRLQTERSIQFTTVSGKKVKAEF